jgi:hypothetical protein
MESKGNSNVVVGSANTSLVNNSNSFPISNIQKNINASLNNLDISLNIFVLKTCLDSAQSDFDDRYRNTCKQEGMNYVCDFYAPVFDKKFQDGKTKCFDDFGTSVSK